MADESRLGKADLHMHSRHDSWGDGNSTVREIFEYVESSTDLDLIALTDHDSTAASREGQLLHRRKVYRFGFVPGVETTTTSGHLLCYFPDEIVDVPSLRSLETTARFVHQHGGFCVLAHPVYPPWTRRACLNPQSRILGLVDGVEVINGGLSPAAQAKLDVIGAALTDRIGLMGNSDAHHDRAIGSSLTTFPGRTVQDLLVALQDRKTRPTHSERVNMPRGARLFTTRRSMTKPGWVRNVYQELSGEHRRTRAAQMEHAG
jgi:predicted metal-dependent phosphoesterase TrpH